jgi:hypothetical protein
MFDGDATHHPKRTQPIDCRHGSARPSRARTQRFHPVLTAADRHTIGPGGRQEGIVVMTGDCSGPH